MWAVFALDACHLFPHCVLDIIPLIGDVQVHSLHAHAQEGRRSVRLQVVGPLAVTAGHTHTPSVLGVVVGARSQDPQHVPREGGGQWLELGHEILGIGMPHIFQKSWGQ